MPVRTGSSHNHLPAGEPAGAERYTRNAAAAASLADQRKHDQDREGKAAHEAGPSAHGGPYSSSVERA